MAKRRLEYIYYLNTNNRKISEFKGVSAADTELMCLGTIDKIAILPSKSEVRLFVNLPKYIDEKELSNMRGVLTKKLPSDLAVNFKIKYKDIAPKQYFAVHFLEIIEEISHRFKRMKSITSLAKYEFLSENKVTVYLLSKFFVKEAKSEKLDEILRMKVKKYTGKDINVHIEVGDFAAESNSIAQRLKQADEKILSVAKDLQQQEKSIVYGRIYNYKTSKIKDLAEGRNIRIIGQCIRYTTKRSNGSIYNEMLIYTEPGSIFIKFFTDKRNPLFREIETDTRYIIDGTPTTDMRSGELMVAAKGILLDAEKEEVKYDCEPRIELHLHTKYSALDSLVDIKKLIHTAKAYKMQALAVTDHGVVHSFPEFFNQAKKAGIIPILGAELYAMEKEGDKKAFHITALVKNKIGLKNIYKIISLCHIKYFYRTPRIPLSVLHEYREGLLFGSACSNGKLFFSIIKNLDGGYIEEIVKEYDYLEIMPIDNNDYLLRDGHYTREKLKEINSRIYQLGKKFGIPVVATGDVHYLEKEDYIVRNILQIGSGFESVTKKPNLFLRRTSELLDEFSYLGTNGAREVVLENPQKLIQSIEEVNPVPDGFYPPVIADSEEKLLKRVWDRSQELYGTPLPPEVKSRIEYELNLITTHKFSVLYYMAMQLVDYARGDGGIVGSRGSVGSSFAAFLAQITEVNPLKPHYLCLNCKYIEFSKNASAGPDLPDKKCPKCGSSLTKDGFNIPFEVFLGFNGEKVPDIDLNFSEKFQTKVHKFTEKLYGENNVYRAGTYSTLQEKNAIGYVMKYIENTGVPINRAEMFRLAKGIIGVKKTTGQHPGGLIVLPENKEIYDFCPVQYPANNKKAGVVITHFEYHSMEQQLVKLDILGQDSPTMLEILRDFTGFNPENVPLDDVGTLKLFRDLSPLSLSKTKLGTDLGVLGIPEFGTNFVQGILRVVRPKTFDELVRISGLAHGTNVWQNNAEILFKEGKTRALKELICARDDVMLYLIDKGLDKFTSFKIMETVRKKNKFLSDAQKKDMKQHKIPGYIIDSCDKIQYLFPKAHAVAYTIMSFRIAYFKLNYPLQYYAAYFTIKRDDFDIETALSGLNGIENEMKRIRGLKYGAATAKDRGKSALFPVIKEMVLRGFEFLPPDIYKSDAFIFKPIPDENKILTPLSAIPTLGTKVAVNIIRERSKLHFKSWDDIRIRTKLTKSTIQVLDRFNALGDLPENEQTLLF